MHKAKSCCMAQNPQLVHWSQLGFVWKKTWGGVGGYWKEVGGVGRGDRETVVPGDDTPTSGFHPARDTETI